MSDFRTRDQRKALAEMFIMTGTSRSGKTTWVNANRKGRAILGRDDLRRVMGMEYIFEAEPMIRTIFEYMVRCVACRRQDIIIDECNLTADSRMKWLGIAAEYGLAPTIVEVATPLNRRKYEQVCEYDDFPWDVVVNQLAAREDVTRQEKVAARHLVVPNTVDGREL